MKPGMKKLCIAACSVAGVLLGLVAAYVYYVYRAQPALTFEKDFVDLRGQTTYEGEVIRIQNSLINHSSTTVEIKGIPASCGCLAIRGNDKPLSFPLNLSPKTRIPIDIEIYTQGRFGEQFVTARAEAIDERGERHESSSLQIAFTVTSRVFVIHDAPFVKMKIAGKKVRPVHHTLLIAARGETCTKLAIETAHEERFQSDIKKTSGAVDYNGLTLSKCFEVELHYLPAKGAEMFSEMLRFIPDEQPALAKNVWFDGIIEYPYRLEPDRFVILNSKKEPKITETAVYRYQDNGFRNLQAKTLPKGFRAVITEYDQNTKLLTFHVNRDEVDWDKTEDIIVFDLGSGEVLEIPVRKIRLD